jgi:hypothetical protein
VKTEERGRKSVRRGFIPGSTQTRTSARNENKMRVRMLYEALGSKQMRENKEAVSSSEKKKPKKNRGAAEDVKSSCGE